MSESIMERIARNKVFIEQFAKMELPVVDGNLVHHRIEVVVPVRKGYYCAIMIARTAKGYHVGYHADTPTKGSICGLCENRHIMPDKVSAFLEGVEMVRNCKMDFGLLFGSALDNAVHMLFASMHTQLELF